MSRPGVPEGLGAEGKRLWAAVLDDFDLSGPELVLLEAACRQADDVATLEEGLRDGFIVEGSKGQPRLNASVTEVRLGRISLARLIAELRLPEEGGQSVGKNPTKARAARTRWERQSRERRLTAVSEAGS